LLGSYLAKNPYTFFTKQFSYRLFFGGVISLVVCYSIHALEDSLYGEKTFISSTLLEENGVNNHYTAEDDEEL